MFKKLLLSFLIGVTFLFSFAPYASAVKAQSWYNQPFAEWYTKVYDNSNPSEIFGERYTAAQVQWITYSLPAMLINLAVDGNTDLATCLMGATSGATDIVVCYDAMKIIIDELPGKFKLAEANPGAQKSLASQVFADRPLSGISYIRNVINKLSPVTTVRAQEAGFGANGALYAGLFLWKAARDISFFLFVLVAVAFAFMVMFRVKLSPQVAITVQVALPKIVVTLILVTFSYAIAGLLVDLMYVIMGLFSTLIVGSLSGSGFVGDLAAGGVFNFINGNLGGAAGSLGGFSLLIYFIFYLILFAIALTLAFVSSLLSVSLSSIVFSLLLVIFWVVLIFILLWYIFKITYVLFKNLAAVYGLVIIGPLQITLGALYPQAGFGAWAKKLFSKLMVFPLTGIFLFLAFILLFDSIGLSLYGILHNNVLFELWNGVMKLGNSLGIPLVGAEVRTLWGPPMLGEAGGATPIAFLLMSSGLIMMLPKIAESIESFLAGKGIQGTAIGEALGPFGMIQKGAQRSLEEGVAPYGRYYGGQAMDKIFSKIPPDAIAKSKILKNIQSWAASASKAPPKRS